MTGHLLNAHAHHLTRPPKRPRRAASLTGNLYLQTARHRGTGLATSTPSFPDPDEALYDFQCFPESDGKAAGQRWGAPLSPARGSAGDTGWAGEEGGLTHTSAKVREECGLTLQQARLAGSGTGRWPPTPRANDLGGTAGLGVQAGTPGKLRSETKCFQEPGAVLQASPGARDCESREGGQEHSNGGSGRGRVSTGREREDPPTSFGWSGPSGVAGEGGSRGRGGEGEIA